MGFMVNGDGRQRVDRRGLRSRYFKQDRLYRDSHLQLFAFLIDIEPLPRVRSDMMRSKSSTDVHSSDAFEEQSSDAFQHSSDAFK